MQITGIFTLQCPLKPSPIYGCQPSVLLCNRKPFNDEYMEETINFIIVFSAVCQMFSPLQAAFAESVLPYLIHDILLMADEARSAVLSSQIGGLLSRVCESSDTKSSRAVSPHLNKGGVRIVDCAIISACRVFHMLLKIIWLNCLANIHLKFSSQ